MRAKVFVALALALVWCAAASAQQAQPLSFVSDYTVRPGKEDEFWNLVKTVGAPVRDTLMADGVIFAWGIDVPLMRAPGQLTHSIWYSVADWDGIEKVQTAMAAQINKLKDEDKKAAEDARKKGGKAPKSLMERTEEVFDTSKTKDWVFRDLVFKYSSAPPPEGALPYSRIFLLTVKPGMFTEYRQLWDKYSKPFLEKMLAEGVINGYGLGLEEVRTSGDFTHFTWASFPNLAAAEKARNIVIADRAARSQEERDHIDKAFAAVTEPAAARSFVLRSIVFKVAPPRK